MATIDKVFAREILDSRGNPTVEVEVTARTASSSVIGRAAVPSGASTGEHEAHELRDGDPKRFAGKGVRKATQHVNDQIAPALRGQVLGSPHQIDAVLLELDGTSSKSKLGANAVLGVSMAAARAGAAALGIPLWQYLGGASARVLPTPMMNIINGGAHADNGMEVQEFMIMPVGLPSFSDALRAGAEVFHVLKKILSKDGHSTNVGDEGGFAPALGSNEDALKYIMRAIETAGYKPGEEVALAMDAAASEFYDKSSKKYRFDGKAIDGSELANRYQALCETYPIVSIEDGFAEDDWEGWAQLTAKLGQRVQLVGDDLFVTNVERLSMGIERKVANSILIKVNQIGTVSETRIVSPMPRLISCSNAIRVLITPSGGMPASVTPKCSGTSGRRSANLRFTSITFCGSESLSDTQ